MTEDEITLKAIAALTAVRGGVEAEYVSELLEEVIPDHFLIPVEAEPQEVGTAVLNQLSGPLSALVTGFVLAFQALAEAYDRTDPEADADGVLQALALAIAREDP